MSSCHFVPPYLLEQIARSEGEAARCGHRTLAVDQSLRCRRALPPPVIEGALPVPAAAGPGQDAWAVYTAANGSGLPGRVVRVAGEPAAGDDAVDEAYAGTAASLALFREVLGRESYDGRGAPVITTVHYETNYDNAFWDGRQLVFGDGDGTVFGRFTRPVDVLAHEFTHAVTQYTAGLTYSGESGALNESVSDVFASCVKQRLLGQSAEDADWLIGAGIFLPTVSGRALRSMAQPGTAYDDPVLGKDRQVAAMAEYVHTEADNGGVHVNSGIPNRAFYLAATGIGGTSWEGAGPIWYAALTSGIGPDTGFAGFAAATVAAARAVSVTAAEAVEAAWDQVGVPAGVPAPAPAPAPAPVPAGSAGSAAGSAGGTIAVRRSGGFGGMERTGRVRLGDDPRTPEIEDLLSRVDLMALGSTRPQPDRFVYNFNVRGDEITVGEHELTPELSRLVSLILEQ